MGFASSSWQRYCTASSSGRQPNFGALNRGHHLCSAGRPSGWALAHILVCTHLQGLSRTWPFVKTFEALKMQKIFQDFQMTCGYPDSITIYVWPSYIRDYNILNLQHRYQRTLARHYNVNGCYKHWTITTIDKLVFVASIHCQQQHTTCQYPYTFINVI